MKDDESKKAFIAEMTYLKNSLRSYSKAFPELSDDLIAHADPTVSRLLEGFSALTSKLQLQLDQSAPELSAAILQTFWSDALQASPSMTIVSADSIHNPICIKEGALLETVRCERDQAHIQFSALRDTQLYPLRIVGYDIHDNILQLDLEKTASFSLQVIDYLDFYIDVATITAMQVYSLFSDIKNISIQAGGQLLQLAGAQLHPIFGKHENGLSLLRQYFLFKEQFLFFRLEGILGGVKDAETLTIQFALNPNRDPQSCILSAIKLNCFPVVNAYRQACDPVTLVQDQVEYPLHFSSQASEQSLLFLRLLSATAMSQKSNRVYRLSQKSNVPLQNEAFSYYCKQAAKAPVISIAIPPLYDALILNCEALVCDGSEVRKLIRIDQPLRLIDHHCVIKVLVRPSMLCEATPFKDTNCLLVEYLQAEWVRFSDVSELRCVLQRSNILNLSDARQIAASLLSVKTTRLTEVKKGIVQHSIRWQINFDQHVVSSIGEVTLFVRVFATVFIILSTSQLAVFICISL